MRRAFAMTMKDPKFIANMERMGVDIDANTGEEVQEAVRQKLAGVTPEMADKIVKALK